MTGTSSAFTCADARLRAALLAGALVLAVAGCGGSHPLSLVAIPALAKPPARVRPAAPGERPRAARARPRASRALGVQSTARPVRRVRRSPPYAVGQRVLTFVDHSRMIRLPGHRPSPRRLVTVIRYPELARGPFPLIVFGHGFAVTPAVYSRLLQSWARAGYVVAAPVFPLENAHAPGGPNEADLVNQPRDMSFVITRMLAASRDHRSPLAGLIDPGRIAVSGQSDGGETALAVAYDRYYRDRRVRAAVILSGAEIPGVGGFDFPAPSPPLLATQGTADTINLPRFTYAFFGLAPRPKYLLKLLGAQHLPPYTYQQPQLSIVERVTIAFLDRYLKGASRGIARMLAAGDIPGRATLVVRR
jgi:dienelactone hydrolase